LLWRRLRLRPLSAARFLLLLLAFFPTGDVGRCLAVLEAGRGSEGARLENLFVQNLFVQI